MDLLQTNESVTRLPITLSDQEREGVTAAWYSDAKTQFKTKFRLHTIL